METTENKKPHVVFITGAGVSRESGILTFRDAEDGYWNNFKISEVADVTGWQNDPQKVLDFYNMRWQDGLDKKPNFAHQLIAKMEKDYRVTVITQNVDDLHEQAGSTNVVHLHGMLNEMKDEVTGTIYPYRELKVGDMSEDGNQLRPNVVWFGEGVPNMIVADAIAKTADILCVVGTSLQVYPACLLALEGTPELRIVIDPSEIAFVKENGFFQIKEKATVGMPIFLEMLQKHYSNK